MHEFKLVLATHAIKNEFEYNIEKSEPKRYRVYCTGLVDGCKWRIHASTMGDNITVHVIYLFIFCSYFITNILFIFLNYFLCFKLNFVGQEEPFSSCLS